MEMSLSGEVGCVSGRVQSLLRTLGGKNYEPLNTAPSGTYPYLAQYISCGLIYDPATDPVVRFRPLREGYRPPLGSRADNWMRMPNHKNTTKYTNSTSKRGFTQGESSAWCTRTGGWHFGQYPTSKRGVSLAVAVAGVALDSRLDKPTGHIKSSDIT